MSGPQGRVQAFQVCARCTTRWQVGSRPGTWCPRCHGVLLSPVSAQAPAQGRRNFRWVARPAPSPVASAPRVVAAPPTPTPHYESTPTWGLRDIPRNPDADRPVDRVERYAANAGTLVVVTGILLILAAGAEFFRYGILLYNRTRLVSPVTLVVSDSLVFFAQIGALLIGLGALISVSCWLIRQRRTVFAAAGNTDPRSVRSILFMSMFPVVRIVMPGVYLTELVQLQGGSGVRQTLRLVRLWWGVWAVSNVLMVVQVLWGRRDTLQARADGVLLAAFVALVAVAVAVLTLALMRRIEGRTLRGGVLPEPTRWIFASPAAQRPNQESANRQDQDQQDQDQQSVESENKAVSVS